MIKTSDAANRYGISGSRIRKLIQDGKVSAKRAVVVEEEVLAGHSVP